MSARATPLQFRAVSAPRRISALSWAVLSVLVTLLFLAGMERLIVAALEFQFQEISQRFVRSAQIRQGLIHEQLRPSSPR
jgi:hypothetical protein